MSSSLSLSLIFSGSSKILRQQQKKRQMYRIFLYAHCGPVSINRNRQLQWQPIENTQVGCKNIKTVIMYKLLCDVDK